MNLLLLKLATVSDSFQKMDQVLGWTQLVKALPSMHRALGSTPNTVQTKPGEHMPAALTVTKWKQDNQFKVIFSCVTSLCWLKISSA